MTEATVVEDLNPEFISIAELINLIKIYDKKPDRASCARILINPFYELLDWQMILVMDTDTGMPLFAGYSGDDANHPSLQDNLCGIIKGAYLDSSIDELEKNLCVQDCKVVGFSRKRILQKISDQSADYSIFLPEKILNHAESFSGRLDKTVPPDSILRVHNETRRELLRLRRQKTPEPPRLETSDTPRQLSPLEQAKADIEHGQQTPAQVTTPPKKTDPRELDSCLRALAIALSMAEIDLSQPHKAAGQMDSYARLNGLPTLSEQTLVNLIKKTKFIKNKE